MKKIFFGIALILIMSCSHKSYDFLHSNVEENTPSDSIAKVFINNCAMLYFVADAMGGSDDMESCVISIDDSTVYHKFPNVIFLPQGYHSLVMLIVNQKKVVDSRTTSDRYGNYKEYYHMESLSTDTVTISCNFERSRRYDIDANGILLKTDK